jgi:serine/threonine-protein kinase
MSPEQIRGEPADPRSDVYSLGALIHVCLTGQPVFDAPRPMGVLTKHLTEPAVAPHVRFPRLGIPASLSAIVLRALEKDPGARFQSVQELQRALVEELRGEGGQGVDALLDSGRVRSLTQAESEAATRDEVERFERKLRRRGQFAWGGAAIGLCSALLLGWRLWTESDSAPTFEGLEVEPNDAASDATPLPFGSEVRGQIGKRFEATRGDRDFYRVQVPPGASFVRIETASLPNIALCTLVYRAGLDSPLGRYCSGSAGADLVVPALELQSGEHLLAVMQDLEDYTGDGAPPVHENVSDVYRLRVSPATPRNDEEREPNDVPRDGTPVSPSGSVQGQLGWTHDVDVVCTTAGRSSVRFVVDDARETARPMKAVLQVTPDGGPADGIPVRVHRAGSDLKVSARDALAPWTSPALEPGMRACIELRLVPNPWAPTPHPRVAPAGTQRWLVQVQNAP